MGVEREAKEGCVSGSWRADRLLCFSFLGALSHLASKVRLGKSPALCLCSENSSPVLQQVLSS